MDVGKIVFFDDTYLPPMIVVERGIPMKSWHIGIVVALVVGYALGILFPSIGTSLRSKAGV